MRTVPFSGRPALPQCQHGPVTAHDSGGRALSRAYFDEVVSPILADRFPGLPFAAARIGSGSDVLGIDDPMSRDHDWGLRLSLFVPEDAVTAVDTALERRLPVQFRGAPARFAFSGDPVSRHRVQVGTVAGFTRATLGFDPRDGMRAPDWLSLSGQSVLEVTAGPVFVDLPGELTAVRAALAWYPDDVWRYVVAADWIRLEQELPLMGRAAVAGDALGSRVIAARLAQVVMHLAFLIERRWPPYSKWLGTLFARLEVAEVITASLDRVLGSTDWRERQAALADALQSLAGLQKSQGLTSVDRATVPFWDRPFVHPDPAIVAELHEGIGDPDVRALPRGRGSIEQRTDNVDVLVDPGARRRAVD